MKVLIVIMLILLVIFILLYLISYIYIYYTEGVTLEGANFRAGAAWNLAASIFLTYKLDNWKD